MRYEILEHTADIGIKAYGEDLEEIFENAAFGMFGLIVDPDTVRPVGEIKVEVRGEDLEDLMVNWLSELLFLHETQGLLLREFDVSIANQRLSGAAHGETIDRTRHNLKLNVKAVTYHLLDINEKEGYATVIFDV